MASRAYDSFSRPNGAIGNAESGQPWVTIDGSPASVQDGKAVFASAGSIMTVNVGLGGGDGTIICDFPAAAVNQALYFRVLDMNRWWRVSKVQYTTTQSYIVGYTEPTYGYVGNGTYYYTPGPDWVHTHNTEIPPGSYGRGLTEQQYYDFDSRVGVYLGRLGYNTIYQPSAPGGFRSYMEHYTYRQVYENQTYREIAPGQPIYSTGSNVVTEVRLERRMNGVTEIIRSATASENVPGFSVTLDGPLITVFPRSAQGQLWGVEDHSLKEATMHGIGSVGGSGSGFIGFDSFSAEPFVLTSYMPPLML